MKTNTANEQSLLLSLDDAAQRLSVSRRTLEREIVHGRFPRPLKIGRSTRVTLQALQQYIQSLSSKVSPV